MENLFFEGVEKTLPGRGRVYGSVFYSGEVPEKVCSCSVFEQGYAGAVGCAEYAVES